MFWPQYLKNQKSLLYNLPQISFWATCISEIFDFGPIEDLLLHNVFLILFLCYCLHKVTFCIHFWKKRKKFDFFSIVFEFPIKFWSRKTVWVLNRVLKIVLDACFCPQTMFGDLKHVISRFRARGGRAPYRCSWAYMPKFRAYLFDKTVRNYGPLFFYRGVNLRAKKHSTEIKRWLIKCRLAFR